MTTRGAGVLRAGWLVPVQASKACPKGHRLAGGCWLAPVLHGRGKDSGSRNVACKKLMQSSCHAAEVWSAHSLTAHINKNAESDGCPRLAGISQTSIFEILKKSDIKPFKIEYYCEKRDMRI